MNWILQTEFEMCSADRADQETRAVERDITMLHAQAIDTLLARTSIERSTVGVVGFHGHTLHTSRREVSLGRLVMVNYLRRRVG